MVEKSGQRSRHLDEVSSELDAFTVSVEHFQEWYIEIIEVIESKEVIGLDTERWGPLSV